MKWISIQVSVLLVCLVCLGAPRGAGADSMAITSGLVSAPWDGELAGWELFGPGTRLTGESSGRSPTFVSGTLVDLGQTLEIAQSPCCPIPQTVNGVTYDPLFLSGFFALSATPFPAPTAQPDTISFFDAPFTMVGRLSGFATPDFSGAPRFAIDLTGSGTATLGPMRAIAIEEGTGWISTSGGLTFRFGESTPPSPTPEPGTLVLLASGVAIAAARRFRRQRR
jgi:hypothetical protein